MTVEKSDLLTSVEIAQFVARGSLLFEGLVPERYNREFLDAIEALVLQGQRALEDGELGRLGQLMELNQKLLNALLLSTAKLEAMCTTARNAGALGAKLTGGGGGGCMIALTESEAQADAVRAALEAEGHEAFATVLGG